MENLQDNQLAFHALKRLYGNKAFTTIQNAKILIVGIGGVGSWLAEALARSGIINIDLVDPDEVCVSNINRQILALYSTVGKSKVSVMKARLKDINPDIKSQEFQIFFNQDNCQKIITKDYDFVVDAIDTLKNKCVLISECKKRNLNVITLGGAAGKKDPSLIKVCDLGKSREDMLLMRLRKKLRRDFNFPKGKKSTFDIPCVYSEELCLYPTKEGEVCQQKEKGANLRLDCESGLGSASFITGTFAFAASAYIINHLAKKAQI